MFDQNAPSTVQASHLTSSVQEIGRSGAISGTDCVEYKVSLKTFYVY